MPPKVDIGKGRKVPKKYVPKGLTEKDKKKQITSILKGKDRPKVESFKSKRSGLVKRFEDKYKHKITDDAFISKNIIKQKGID